MKSRSTELLRAAGRRRVAAEARRARRTASGRSPSRTALHWYRRLAWVSHGSAPQAR